MLDNHPAFVSNESLWEIGQQTLENYVEDIFGPFDPVGEHGVLDKLMGQG